MNALLMPLRQLVDRKLWPLAILLIAALAAIPMLLGKDETVVPPTPLANAAPAGEQSPTQPIVTLGDAAERERSRKVLGTAKNPFKPAEEPKSETDPESKPKGPESSAPAAGDGGGGGDKDKGASQDTSNSGGAGAPADDAPVSQPVAPVQPDPSYSIYTAKVRFGKSTDDSLSTRLLRRLTALPRMAEPKVTYLGLESGLKSAVFLLAANTQVIGEGRCLPSRSNCQTISLKAGETVFVEVLDGAGQVASQYQLEMVRVEEGEVADMDSVEKWRNTIARGGRDALRENLARVNGWQYDAERGIVYRKK